MSISIGDKILNLTKQFYPTGRAFKMPFDGTLERLHLGLGVSETQAYSDAISILNAVLPDNDGFTVDDATDWERRLGMITSSNTPLADRKLAILRKLQAPGVNPAKQHYLYLESQLQAAGFNVFVYENRFPDYPDGYVTENPLVLTGGVGAKARQYGQFQYGQVQYGSTYGNIVANSLDESVDASFGIGLNLRSTFFIGANPLGTFANVLASREIEFRQLILKIKPVQTVGFLFVNYI